jgi:hypothetical protein
MHFNLLPVLIKCARQVQELQQQGRMTPDLKRVIQAGGIMPAHANMGALPAMGFNWQQQPSATAASSARHAGSSSVCSTTTTNSTAVHG